MMPQWSMALFAWFWRIWHLIRSLSVFLERRPNLPTSTSHPENLEKGLYASKLTGSSRERLTTQHRTHHDHPALTPSTTFIQRLQSQFTFEARASPSTEYIPHPSITSSEHKFQSSTTSPRRHGKRPRASPEHRRQRRQATVPDFKPPPDIYIEDWSETRINAQSHLSSTFRFLRGHPDIKLAGVPCVIITPSTPSEENLSTFPGSRDTRHRSLKGDVDMAVSAPSPGDETGPQGVDNDHSGPNYAEVSLHGSDDSGTQHPPTQVPRKDRSTVPPGFTFSDSLTDIAFGPGKRCSGASQRGQGDQVSDAHDSEVVPPHPADSTFSPSSNSTPRIGSDAGPTASGQGPRAGNDDVTQTTTADDTHDGSRNTDFCLSVVSTSIAGIGGAVVVGDSQRRSILPYPEVFNLDEYYADLRASMAQTAFVLNMDCSSDVEGLPLAFESSAPARGSMRDGSGDRASVWWLEHQGGGGSAGGISGGDQRSGKEPVEDDKMAKGTARPPTLNKFSFSVPSPLKSPPRPLSDHVREPGVRGTRATPSSMPDRPHDSLEGSLSYAGDVSVSGDLWLRARRRSGSRSQSRAGTSRPRTRREGRTHAGGLNDVRADVTMTTPTPARSGRFKWPLPQFPPTPAEGESPDVFSSEHSVIRPPLDDGEGETVSEISPSALLERSQGLLQRRREESPRAPGQISHENDASMSSTKVNVTMSGGNISLTLVDHDARRYRDQYRHPAYSRPSPPLVPGPLLFSQTPLSPTLTASDASTSSERWDTPTKGPSKQAPGQIPPTDRLPEIPKSSRGRFQRSASSSSIPLSRQEMPESGDAKKRRSRSESEGRVWKGGNRYDDEMRNRGIVLTQRLSAPMKPLYQIPRPAVNGNSPQKQSRMPLRVMNRASKGDIVDTSSEEMLIRANGEVVAAGKAKRSTTSLTSLIPRKSSKRGQRGEGDKGIENIAPVSENSQGSRGISPARRRLKSLVIRTNSNDQTSVGDGRQDHGEAQSRSDGAAFDSQRQHPRVGLGLGKTETILRELNRQEERRKAGDYSMTELTGVMTGEESGDYSMTSPNSDHLTLRNVGGAGFEGRKRAAKL